MNNRFTRLFWGPASPLSTLAGAGLLIMASARTAFALITLAALVWVYALTALAICLGGGILPRRGRALAVICVSSVSAGFFLLMLFLLNPFLALETYLYVILAPICCHASGLPGRVRRMDPREGLVQALLEALLYGALLAGLSLVREVLGLGSLSLPGGSGGLVEVFRRKEAALIPVRVLDGSAGAFLIFGYGVAFFNRVRSGKGGQGEGP